MIQLQVQVLEGRVGIYTSGFCLSSSRIYSNKEALARLRDAAPTWMALVPTLIAYLLEHFPDEAWRIKVVVDGIGVRKFESALIPVLSKVVRKSRYGRDPVI